MKDITYTDGSDSETCLSGRIMTILESYGMDHFKTIEINEEILIALSESFNLKSISLDVGGVKIVSDNTSNGTYITIGEQNEELDNVASINWKLLSQEIGKLNLEFNGIGTQ